MRTKKNGDKHLVTTPNCFQLARMEEFFVAHRQSASPGAYVSRVFSVLSMRIGRIFSVGRATSKYLPSLT